MPTRSLVCVWNGLVFSLADYSQHQLRVLARDLESDNYTWEVGALRFPRTPAKVAYLTGSPTQS